MSSQIQSQHNKLEETNSYLHDKSKQLSRVNEELEESQEEMKVLNETLEDKVEIQTEQLIRENKRTKQILNAQTSITIVSDEENASTMNDTFFKVFDFKDMDDFNKQHNCICELFIDKKETPCLKKEINGIYWITYILDNPHKTHLAYMLDKNGEERVYNVNVNNNDLTENIIVLTDITELLELVKQDKFKEKRLFESQKMASMGEMIGNIAHQWRQPLGSISSIVSTITLKQELNILETDEIKNSMSKINDRVQYLSSTIDTFRNFMKEKKELKELVIQDRINMAINIVSASLKDSYIELKTDIESEPINITMVTGEFDQVIINIINNAKDIIKEKNIKNAWIELILVKIDNKAIITIEDNGGGVPEEILPKIFEPYFTTKHQSEGTGLGLHMSYQIVVESLKGSLKVENTDNGAKFIIELPLCKIKIKKSIIIEQKEKSNVKIHKKSHKYKEK